MINEVIDTSSDSEDMFIPTEHNDDEDIDAIVNKYIRENALESLQKDPSNSRKVSYELTISSDEEESECPKEKKAKRINEKGEKMAQKRKKQEERARKQAEKQLEKAMKQAKNLENKNLKPEECMKFITVHIAEDLMQECGKEIAASLNDVNYESSLGLFSNSVTWTRKVQSHIIDDSGKVTVKEETEKTNEVLILITANELITWIDSNTLLNFIQNTHDFFQESKKIYVAIFGLKEYFSYLKRIKDHEKRAEISENVRKLPANQKYEHLPIVTKSEVENALTELQLFHSCTYQIVDSKYDFALMVAHFTKSIAQLPYKLQKQETHQKAEWYMSGDKKDCVKVDKDGNGLKKLWKQCLTTFPLAGLEISEAISSIYPTLTSLMKAYDNCQSEQEGKQLLQDIPIRRGAGLLTESRRIGPELSKKVYNFFTSTSPDDFIS